MPDLDGGHYFFTAVVPIRNDAIVDHEGFRSSPVHMVREALETLPTALQSHAAEEIGIQSPFARSKRTHFARFVVLDQPFYNGRDRADAIVSAIRQTDLLMPQPHDVLSCPYLLVMIEFDPIGVADEAHAYCEELWRLMPAELTAVFRYCYGFDAKAGAAGFAEFLLPCRIETTMPFNDYWTGTPPLPSLSKAALLAIPVAGLLLPFAAAIAGWIGVWTALAIGLTLAASGLVLDYVLIMRRGAKPLPAAPDATLRHVLKALYLQQAFTRFAIEQQGRNATAQGAAFRAFLRTHQPANLDRATQPPGVIRSRLEADV